MDWFMASIDSGGFEVENPFNRRRFRVASTPDRVSVIVFWSKNFGPFLERGDGNRLSAMGYNLFFNFTVNGGSPPLEAHLPPLNDRLDQLAQLCETFGPDVINWRFDPVCFFTQGNGGIENNTGVFSRIADRAGRLGIRRCITSFMDMYPKIRKRSGGDGSLHYIEPSMAVRVETATAMAGTLAPHGIRLMLCCEPDVLALLPEYSGVGESACISGQLLSQLFDRPVPLRRDRGQRTASGCRCTVSSDIGSYRRHPCPHNCHYCYANPAAEPVTKGPGEPSPK
jgi:hypothetical protein